MTDPADDDLGEFDLAPWAPPPAPAGVADAVIAQMRRAARPSHAMSFDSGEPGDSGARRARWPWLVATGVISAAAAVAITMLAMTSTDVHQPAPIAPSASAVGAQPSPGELAATRAQHLDLGGAIVDVEAGAAIRWQRNGARVHVEQLRGTASWTVDATTELVIDAGATVASVEATGASLRVETPMNLADPRLLSATAIAAAALVAITVYDGHVRATGGGQTVTVAPGSTVTVAPGGPPQEPAVVATLPVAPSVDPAPVGGGDPSASPPKVARQNHMTASDIDQVVRGKASQFRMCYQRALTRRSPPGEGEVVVSFAVEQHGEIVHPEISAKSTLRDAEVERCLIAVARTLQFPPTPFETNVNYPFRFSNPSSTVALEKLLASPGPGGAAPPSTDIPDSLDRAGIVDGIAKVRARVMACGDKSTAHGMVKLALTVAADGTVSRVDVRMTPDLALGSCVSQELRRATFAKTVNGGTFAYPFNF